MPNPVDLETKKDGHDAVSQKIQSDILVDFITCISRMFTFHGKIMDWSAYPGDLISVSTKSISWSAWASAHTALVVAVV